MYTDMYNTFDNECIPYSFPFSFQKHKQDYMIGNEPTYEMDYGDTAVIPFQIDLKYYDYYINICIYNFRFEEVYSYTTTINKEGIVELLIDADTSMNIFKKGRYYCKVQAERHTNFYDDICTLINPSDCMIYVR